MRVTPDVLDAIVAHARREHPRECCGILVGTRDTILQAVETRNVAGDPLRRYEVDPAGHIAQIRRCRASGADASPVLEIVGVYHSHPYSAPVPSPDDVAQAFAEYLYVIAGPVDGREEVRVRGYRFVEGEPREIELLRTDRHTSPVDPDAS